MDESLWLNCKPTSQTLLTWLLLPGAIPPAAGSPTLPDSLVSINQQPWSYLQDAKHH
jgi:hypothetical protein